LVLLTWGSVALKFYKALFFKSNYVLEYFCDYLGLLHIIHLYVINYVYAAGN
jgi:hypothetical protein